MKDTEKERKTIYFDINRSKVKVTVIKTIKLVLGWNPEMNFYTFMKMKN